MWRKCLLFVLAANYLVEADGPTKLLLSVYYESQCPDSKSFILNQLVPTMDILHEYVKLRLIPFGKSKSLDYGFAGFDCQHGQEECISNMVQDCTLFVMKHVNDLNRLAYVACEMESGAAAKGNIQCIEKAGVPAQLVQDCLSTEKGIILQLESEYFTQVVNPQFIPTITLNEEFNQQVQDSALFDLTGTICSILRHAPPCAQHYNNLAWQYVMCENCEPQINNNPR